MSDREQHPITAERHPLAVGVIGGPTTVIDLGGYRIVSDPTFDGPGDYGLLHKTQAPAVSADALGPVDIVLISHDEHADNLDRSGRDFALAAPLGLAPPAAAGRLGAPAVPLAAWESWTLGDLTITAVPAQHGPFDAARDERGFVNCEVVGFVVQAADTPVVYVSGDNASLAYVREVREHFGAPAVAVLHGGAASLPVRFEGRPLSLTSQRVVAGPRSLTPNPTTCY